MPINNNIEELVNAASQTHDQQDISTLLQDSRRCEVFMPLGKTLHDGKKAKTVPLLALPDGTRAMMLYTSKSHPDLPNTFGGATLESALRSAVNMPAVDWVILTNQDSKWISISKAQISAYLETFSNAIGDALQPAHDQAVDAEVLISRIVGSAAAGSVSAIIAALQGRELFLDMSCIEREDGQRSMNSFLIEPLGPVVRAYTSRLRPGIKYGGIRWNALSDMVRKLPEIKGVQVMNNSDDWIVIDRKGLGLDDAT